MQNKDLKTIDIYIAGKTFPVEITPDEEETILSLASTLNQKITDFQVSFPGRDKIDYVIMTLLSHTYDLHKSSDAITHAQSDAFEKVKQISSILDASLATQPGS